MNTEKAGMKDTAALVRMRINYLTEDFGGLDEETIRKINEDLPDYFERHLNRDLFCYVIRENNEIVSTAFLLVIEKPMSPAFLNGKTGTVLNVYTEPAYRKKGHARKLMEKLLEDAAEMNLCRVELKATEMGYALYQSLGFIDDHSHYHEMKWIPNGCGGK